MDKVQIHNEEFLKIVGKRIKALRLKSGYTSYETFALENDLDRKQYWRAEKGSNLTLKTLYTIIKIHHISMEEFFQNL
ncbi:MAG: helix-turn-helix transcriptional regulator [Brumimicrobium sp.]